MPMPLSVTLKRTPATWLSNVQGTTLSITLAWRFDCLPENLMALPIRLSSTWRSRVGSHSVQYGKLGETKTDSSTSRESDSVSMSCAACSTTSRKWVGILSISSLPASILEKSRMSLRMCSKANDESFTVPSMRRCSAPNSVCCKMSTMPTMPLSGVRISWLMLAKNSDLARLAEFAVSLAERKASSASLRSVMSSCVPTRRSGLPSALWLTTRPRPRVQM